MIPITQELKDAIVAEINEDADFGYRLFRAIMHNAGDRIVSTTYLDRALARLAAEHDQRFASLECKNEEHDQRFASLERKNEEHDHRFEKIEGKLEEHDHRFEKIEGKLEEHDRRLEEIDHRFDEQTAELKNFINARFGQVGSRWGMNVEASYREFAAMIVEQWGGTVTKWKRTFKLTDETGRVQKVPYEIDVVVTNGKLLLAELKASCDLDGIDRFLVNVDQYLHLNQPTQPVEKIIVTFNLTPSADERARDAGITVIMPE
jgi:hypothetical protein